MLVKTVDEFGENDFQGVRAVDSTGAAGNFEWTSYSAVFARIVDFGRGLEALDLLCKSSDNSMRLLGLFGRNAPEWVIAEFGGFRQGATTVPLYASLEEKDVEFVVNQTGLGTIVCSSDLLSKLRHGQDLCPALKNVVVFGKALEDLDLEITKDLKKTGVRVFSMKQVENAGRESNSPANPPKADTPFSFCYTSGSTGDPKGAVLDHRAMVANIAAFREHWENTTETKPTSEEYHLSYLPLAHQFERTFQAVMISYGARVGFSQGQAALIMADVKALRPTFWPTVPRLFVRLHDSVCDPRVADAKFQFALRHKLMWLRKGCKTHWLWDRLVFKPIAESLGLDRLKLIATGSAPIAGHVLDNMRIILPNTMVVEGYGQTELTCMATCAHQFDFSHSHVGPPATSCEIRLKSVPEMNYLVSDREHPQGSGMLKVAGRGEVQVRGPTCMIKYYACPDKTASTKTEGGWVTTGDIGAWLPEGNLKIIDRRNNIFKLAQAEFVAPDKIQNIVQRSTMVAQCFVYGTTLWTCLIAVVVPDEPMLRAQMGEYSRNFSFQDLCKDPKVAEEVLRDMIKMCKMADVKGYEIPKAVFLDPEPFSPENGILTPTMKLRRSEAKKRYANVCERLYASLGKK